MLEEEEAAVAMTSKYSSETCDDEEWKKLAIITSSRFSSQQFTRSFGHLEDV